ncbi:MAG: PASTA domain-containing protein [Planctomycetes bacterium]|nr:PASTA domain-containing protein [Planctomycetota bacterium]
MRKLSKLFVLIYICTISLTLLSAPVQAGTIDVRVNADDDDAEETNSDGDMLLTSTDMELINDDEFHGGDQTIGLRFNNIQIDQGAIITNAYIQFTTDETLNDNPCNLTIKGQDIDDAPTFTTTAYNITGRSLTSASTAWSPPDWNSEGEAGTNQATSNIAAVIQEIVARPDWARGNSIVIIITGTGRRVAEAHNGSAGQAPLLHVEDVSGWVVLTSDNFESGFGNYTDGGGDCSLYTGGTYAHQGSNAADIQDNSGDASAFFHTSGINVDAPGYDQIKIDFWFKAIAMDSGENFFVEYYDGSSWVQIANYISGTNFSNDTFYNETIIINEGTYTFPTDMKIKFRCDAGQNGDDVYIDEVIVYAKSGGDDLQPPEPNPATFASAPSVVSPSAVTMTATTGSDATPPIEYRFVETTGNTGGTTSSWQTNPVYSDTGLDEGTAYAYTVQMRDSNSIPNVGSASTPPQAVTTTVTVPDVTGLLELTAQTNITAVGLTVGTVTYENDESVPMGKVISQNPVASTAVNLGSAVSLVISNGSAMIGMEELEVLCSFWLQTGCGICGGVDYSGDNNIDGVDFAYLAALWYVVPQTPTTIVINEFMASNNTTTQDPQGEYDDWIELYNHGTETVDLSGMYIADDSTLWQIPSGTTLNPGNYLIIWADEDIADNPSGIHADFKLTAGGDEVRLFKSDGTTLIDSIAFGPQTTDISYGRYADATDNWYNMDSPTPGATNSVGMSPKVWFSQLSGTFISTFSLELDTVSPTAVIRYTTDGSLPTGSSSIYGGPISINNSQARRIRARSYEPGLTAGLVTSHYYIPLASDIQTFSSNLPIVIIDSFGENIDDNGGLGCGSFSYAYQPVASVFLDLDKDTGLASTTDLPDFAGRSGSRIRGESSRCWAKRQYSFELWDEYDEDEKHSLLGMKSESDWVLQAPYSDKTLLRNILTFKWANDIMSGFAAPGTKLIEVFYNQNGGNCSYADYRGVYVLTEKIKVSNNRVDIGNLDPADSTEPEITGGYILRVDKDNGQETFSTSNIGAVQYFDPDEFDLTSTQKTWIQNHISEFEGVLNGGGFADPVTGYAKYIDVESFIEADIIYEISKNSDGFKLSTYFHKAKNGKIVFGPMWDFNLSSGNTKDVVESEGYSWWYPVWFAKATTSEGWYNPNFAVYGWHSRLMDDLEYKLGTADKWFEHREDKLSDAQILADISSYYTLLTTNVAFAGHPDNAVDRNFDKFNILNVPKTCNYYFGNNPQLTYEDIDGSRPIDPADREQANLPHTYAMELEWLKNWFTGQGTPTGAEWYIADYSDRMGNLDAYWASNRNMVAPPSLFINASPADTGATITFGDTLTMTAATAGTIYYTLDGTDPRQAVTGNAIGTLYSGGITLNQTVKVRARIKNGSNWSALNKATFADGQVLTNLRITELMYHPKNAGPPTDPNEEFIELKNIGGSTISLFGAKFTNGVDFIFPGITLAAGQYVLVVEDQNAFEAEYGTGFNIAGEYTGKLSNGGEEIKLKDAAENTILEFDYNDDWYPITDGIGFSLNVINPANPDPNSWEEKASWQASTTDGGTPEAAHSAAVETDGDVVINEVLTHTDDLVDGDWIELRNTTGSIISIGGWFLSDNISDLKKYEIAGGTTIPANGYIAFTAVANFRNSGGDPGAHTNFGLSELGERVFLTSGSASNISGGYSTKETFGAANNDVSFGRYIKSLAADYDIDFVSMVSRTKAAVNSAPMVPDVVITEIHYNPDDNPDILGEYIELYNQSGSTVTLYDPSNPNNTWRFTNGIGYTFPTGITMTAGERILVTRCHPDIFTANYSTGGVQVFGPFDYETELVNSGEKLELSEPGSPEPGGFVPYIRLEQVNYSDGVHPAATDPWPTSPDGRGDSLGRKINSNYSNDIDNWQAITPSPGS